VVVGGLGADLDHDLQSEREHLLAVAGARTKSAWTKKYFLKLQAIYVLGSDRESAGGGLFKGESLLTAQLQYNFNLL
jgi:hypothetical protein